MVNYNTFVLKDIQCPLTEFSMPFKRLFFILLLSGNLASYAQYQATVSSVTPYRVNQEASFSSYANEWNNFLLFKRIENKENIYSLVMTDNDDHIVLTSDLRVATVVENNHFLLAGVALAGRNLTAFVESRNAKTGRNVLAMQAADNKGGLTSEGMLVGYFDSKEPDNAGAWHITSTPDQMHIALIAQLPHETQKPDRFMYYFINENLTITNKGEFAISTTDDTAITVDQFLASDQGDLYVVSNGKNAGFPTVYKANIRSTEARAIPVNIPDTKLSGAGWLAVINPHGGLNIVGCLKDPSLPVQGNVKGTWNFETDRPEAVFINNFDQPREALKIKNILFNADTYFAVAEGNHSFQVTGFDTLNHKKFEVLIPHSPNSDQAKKGIAAGILQNKLCLIYNDAVQPSGAGEQHHAVASEHGLHNTRLATLTFSISNEGKHDPPIILNHEQGAAKVLSPWYFSAAEDRIVTLLENPEGIRAVAFR
jgi:hypothetical protein